MTRRSWLQSFAAFFVPGPPEKPPAEPCLTPAYAGFDGSFYLNGGRYLIRLLRCFVDSPKRYTGLPRNVIGVWRNHDGSVSKLLYRNRDGKLFDLKFVPMEEPA